MKFRPSASLFITEIGLKIYRGIPLIRLGYGFRHLIRKIICFLTETHRSELFHGFTHDPG